MLPSGLANIVAGARNLVWDILPVIPVLTGAGAMVSGWRGEDASSAKSCAAANRVLHPQVLTKLSLD